jgi:maltose alpha-D-glucosyltransferase/alpha-amylase
MMQDKKQEATEPVAGFGNDPLWYKDAVIYQLHIKSFFDSTNDGVGDFSGLIEKLDYIVKLGVNTIWLLPFYPSPRRDDGYDISAYLGVHPDYGTMDDARRFIQEAHARGLRVITELVINHTSDQHPWFQRARAAPPNSAERNFYVWADSDTGYAGTRIIFLDTEKSNWTWDSVANAFFWHRFYSHQPDLNFDNPEVLTAILDVMTYWLELGVDGLRLDAVPYLIEREGTSNENLAETHVILKKIREHLNANFPDRMLLAEANMWPEDVQQYFGNGDECHMAFHFPLMPRMYMALAQEDRFPITDILRQTPDIPAACQWAVFLRNHDELTLEMVTDRERDYLWNHYAADRRARINLGIRRRLSPLVERDRRRVELLQSFLLSMPGTPVMYYGDEIGMGDNIHLGDRDGVRTPMQWAPDRNGGFSRANPASLVLPPIMDPLYGFEAINVEAQNEDPYSLLNWMRRLLQVRSKHRAFGRGSLKLIYPNNRKILAYLREYQETSADGICNTETILCVANVSHASQAVEIDLTAFAGKVPVEMLGGVAFPPIGQLPYLLTLPPFGFYWFVLANENSMPAWYRAPVTPLPDYQTLVLPNGAADLVRGTARHILENETLPAYLPLRRWYAGKKKKLQSVQLALAAAMPVPVGTLPMMLTELVIGSDGDRERYFLPLGVIAEGEVESSLPQQLALARVRRERRVGMLTDAFSLDAFANQVLKLIQEETTIPTSDGDIVCSATLLHQTAIPANAEIRRLSVESTNSTLAIGDTVVIKMIRHLTSGLHPELEMGSWLTAKGFQNIPLVLGDMTRWAKDGQPNTLIILQRFIHSQGNALRWMLNTLDIVVRTAQHNRETESPTTVSSEIADLASDLVQYAEKLGTRLAELHTLLAQATDDPAFQPETLNAEHCSAISQQVLQRLNEALGIWQSSGLFSDELEELSSKQFQQAALSESIEQLACKAFGALRIRIHGNLQLNRILVSSGDAFFLDFEGDTASSLEQRRKKDSPWRDVASVLQSYEQVARLSLDNGPTDLDEAAKQHRRKLIQQYISDSRQTFLTAYRSAAPDSIAADALLDLYMLEKAASEVCRIAANEPASLSPALRNLIELSGQLSHKKAQG